MAKTLKSTKAKKITSYEAACFFVNFCAIFTLVFTFSLLALGNSLGGRNTAATVSGTDSMCSANSCLCDTEAADEPAVLYPVTAGEPNEGAVSIVVDDSGYSQKKFELTPLMPILIEITNKGVNDHSFVIDELGIDSGKINPGETRKMVLKKFDDVPQVYIFYSNLASDDVDKFSGRFVVE